MILLTLLAIIMLGLLIYGIAALCVGGVALFVVFGDAIVCAGLIYLIIRAFVKKRKS